MQSTPTTTTLGELASRKPAATRVFLRHRLDFCCGGHRTLAEACERAGLDAAAVAREIETEAAPDDAVDWSTRSPSELADHIERRYHDALRRDVPALIEAATRVERVHAGKPDVPAGLADVVTEFWEEMEDHMAKEERVLFPMLRQGARGRAVYMPVRMMEQEHDAHGRRLAEIRRLTSDFRPPAHACATWIALYSGLDRLETELMEHIHLENNILFRRAVLED